MGQHVAAAAEPWVGHADDAAACEEELTVAPLGTTALVQLRTVLTSHAIQAEVVATVLDQDLADVADHITDFISGIEFTPAPESAYPPTQSIELAAIVDHNTGRPE